MFEHKAVWTLWWGLLDYILLSIDALQMAPGTDGRCWLDRIQMQFLSALKRDLQPPGRSQLNAAAARDFPCDRPGNRHIMARMYLLTGASRCDRPIFCGRSPRPITRGNTEHFTVFLNAPFSELRSVYQILISHVLNYINPLIIALFNDFISTG
ncbi:hypothetical protein J6590_012203 [Homalodisca vitripennis]|nr:hypothetical protein J6590_012203 [Homalodisca vitripennis]